MAAYFLTPTIRGKNLTTLAFSLIFYGWGQPRFVLVLLTSIAFNTVAALFIDRCEGRARTTALAAAVTCNLLLLAVFKYAGFIIGNLDSMMHPLGLTRQHYQLS